MMEIAIIVVGLAVTLAAWDGARRAFDPEAKQVQARLEKLEKLQPFVVELTETVNEYGKRVAELERVEAANRALAAVGRGTTRVR